MAVEFTEFQKFSFMNANCKTSRYFPFKIRWL